MSQSLSWRSVEHNNGETRWKLPETTCLESQSAGDTPPSRLVWETATPNHIVSLILGLYQQLSVPQKKFSLSLQRGFFELHQWSWCIIFWSEMSGFIWVGQCALGLPGNQPTIRDPNSIPPSSTSSVSCTSFQMYLCAHMWYLSYKCFHASTTMWSQLSIINQALFA